MSDFYVSASFIVPLELDQATFAMKVIGLLLKMRMLILVFRGL